MCRLMNGRVTGSPPRAWGRRVHSGGLHLVSTVHPHVRGDDVFLETERKKGIGSPPRAWGRRGLEQLPLGFERFTPTCVGTTSCAIPSR